MCGCGVIAAVTLILLVCCMVYVKIIIIIFTIIIEHIQHYYSFKLHNVIKQKTVHWNREVEETNIQLPSNGTAELWHSL